MYKIYSWKVKHEMQSSVGSLPIVGISLIISTITTYTTRSTLLIIVLVVTRQTLPYWPSNSWNRSTSGNTGHGWLYTTSVKPILVNARLPFPCLSVPEPAAFGPVLGQIGLTNSGYSLATMFWSSSVRQDSANVSQLYWPIKWQFLLAQ